MAKHSAKPIDAVKILRHRNQNVYHGAKLPTRVGRRLKDVYTDGRAKYINSEIAGTQKAIQHMKTTGASPERIAKLQDRIHDFQGLKKRERAKMIGAYALPVAAVALTPVAIHKIQKTNKKRKEEEKMNKMSAEDYTVMVEKLAEEILDGTADVTEVDDVDVDVAGVDEIAKRAFAALEAAGIQKQAAEEDYETAEAYEEAALDILDELDAVDDYDADYDDEYYEE